MESQTDNQFEDDYIYEEIEEIEEIEEVVEELESDDEESEDLLKFIHFKTNILDSDRATALWIHDRFIALGTDHGVVYVLDFEGSTIKRVHTHQEPVIALMVDTGGEVIASCSMSGTVIISHFYTDKHTHKVFERPVTAIAIHPQFSTRENAPWICGNLDGNVTLISSTRFIFKNSSERILHSGEGKIQTLSWHNEFVSWVNERSVIVYDISTFTIIFKHRKPEDMSTPYRSLYKPSLHWIDDDLLVGWGSWVLTINLRLSLDDTKTRFASIKNEFLIRDATLCGLAPFAENIILLTYTSDPKAQEKHPPVLRVVTPRNELITSFTLKIIDYTSVFPMQMSLFFSQQSLLEGVYYFMSPKELLVIRPCDEDDHIAWLLKHNKFEEAIIAAKNYTSTYPEHTLSHIGEVFLRRVISEGQSRRGARMLPTILGMNNDEKTKKAWEYWTAKLVKADKSVAIELAGILPRVINGKLNGPEISSTVYEYVLSYFIQFDPPLFKISIKEFRSLYDYPALTKQAQTQILQWQQSPPNNKHWIEELGEALGLLYEFQGLYSEALDQLIEVGGGVEIFEFMKRHDLVSQLANSKKMARLLECNAKNAVKFFIDHINYGTSSNEERGPLHPDNLMKNLEPDQQFTYLHELFQVPKSARYMENHYNTLALMYIKFKPQYLSFFLRSVSSSNRLNLKEIRKRITGDDAFVEEEVFLLERMGFREEALDLIITKLKSVRRAVSFCLRTDDNGELFRKLIDKVLEICQEAKSVTVILRKTTRIDTIAELYGIPKEDIQRHNRCVDLTKLDEPATAVELDGIPIKIPIDMLSDLLRYVGDPPEDMYDMKTNTTNILNPKDLLMRIPENQSIPNIGEKLSKIVKVSQGHTALLTSLTKVLRRDAWSLQCSLENMNRKAISVDFEQFSCSSCGQLIWERASTNETVIFACSHAFHRTCYLHILKRWQDKKQLPSDLYISAHRTSKNCVSSPETLLFEVPGLYKCPPHLEAFPFCVRCTVAKATSNNRSNRLKTGQMNTA